MKIIDLAIRYRPSIVVLTVLLTLGGLTSYLTIPKESYPSIEIPNIIVTSVYPGASPNDIETLLTQPIEQEVQSITGIKEIRSTSLQGVSSIQIEFDPNVTIDIALQRVRDKVAVAVLPEDVEEPTVYEIDLQEFPIMSINLSATYSLARLKDVAEVIVDELEAIPSILEVDLIGGLEREVKVNVNLTALQGYGLTFSDVVSTIEEENRNIPGGSINVDRRNYLVRINGEFSDPERDISRLVLASPDNRPVYIRDVAQVEFGFKDRESYARLRLLQQEDGNRLYSLPAETTRTLPVITLGVKKRSGENILQTASAVKRTLATHNFPPGTNYEITGDQSETVQTFVNDLENNIISGLIFVVLVLLFFLGVRNASLVGIAIPLSMFCGFIVFQALGEDLNFVVLFSLIIALGMLVDNAVVIVENIYRYREMGYARFEAARRGSAEVGSAVVASTATTVAAFAPMLFWPGLIGEFMGFLPMTLIITLSCSLFVAIVINPVITGYFVRLESEGKQARTVFSKRISTAVIIAVGLVLGFMSWKSLIVLVGALVVFVVLNRKVLTPVANRVVRVQLPRLLEWYRGFLDTMLHRDYAITEPVHARRTLWLVGLAAGLAGCVAMGAGLHPALQAVLGTQAQALMPFGMLLMTAGSVVSLIAVARTRNPWVRNVFALGSFSGGFVLLCGGGLLSMVAGQAAGLVLLMPGMFLLISGTLGIFLHTLEVLFLGGRVTIRGGIIFGVTVAVILLLMSLTRGMEVATMAVLISLPALVIVVGVVGWLLNGRVFARRTNLMLTDNRARLLTATLGGFFAILGLVVAAQPGSEFFGQTDPSQLLISLKGPLGTNLEQSNRVAYEAQNRIDEFLEEYANDKANVKNILVNVGGGSGDAFFGGGNQGAENSSVTLNMVDYEDRPETSRNTMTRLRNELQGLPGVEIEVEPDQVGPPVGAPINIEISGEDFNEIVRITRNVRDILAEASRNGDIVGLVDLTDNLNTGRPELQVVIDRGRAAQFGLSTQKIANTVRNAINGFEASKYRSGDDEYPIIVRLSEVERESLESIERLTILNEGRQIPITAVARFAVTDGFGSITRLDLARVATVTADVEPGMNGNAVLAEVQDHLSEYEASMPTGYRLAYTGESEEQREAFGFLSTALLIGVLGIFFIMIAQFNNVAAPLIIIVAVGLSLIGVLLGLILTRTPFGLMTFIGVISLAGIVVNNNIVLIDYIKQLRERGLEKTKAIIEGGATRLRPVVLTALTTIIGLVPLTFGINIDFVGLISDWAPNFQLGSENSQFWGAMGTAIISGLTFATFLTLVIVPVMYSVFDSLIIRLRSLFSAGEDTDAE